MCLLVTQALAWEYNPTEKLLSLSLERYDAFSEEEVGELQALGAWSTAGNDTLSLVPLNYYLYGLNVSIGTPPQNGTLLVLNDQKNTFIFAQNCKSSGRKPFFNPASSTTFVTPATQTRDFKVFRVDVKANQGQDTLCLNSGTQSLCQTNQLIELITEIDVSDATQYGTTTYDGWLGLGYEPVSASSVGFMARAVYSGLIAKNVYSYESTPSGANLVLGGYNATNF